MLCAALSAVVSATPAARGAGVRAAAASARAVVGCGIASSLIASRAVPNSATFSTSAPAFAASAQIDGDVVEVVHAGGDSQRMHALWLRDNCRCDLCVHASSLQKRGIVATLPPDLAPVEAAIGDGLDAGTVVHYAPTEPGIGAGNGSTGEGGPWLRVRFSDGHASAFPLSWLGANGYPSADPNPLSVDPIPWAAADLPVVPSVSFDEFIGDGGDPGHEDSDTIGLWKAVSALGAQGLALITDVPTDDHLTIQKVAERIGCLRNTLYGSTWDVRNIPYAENIAYTAIPLPLHMDLCYYESPPGLQLLHCLEFEAQGGESTFADAFKAVEILRADRPDYYDILSKVDVTFHYHQPDHVMRFVRPIIDRATPNHAMRLFWSPPFEGPIPALSPDDAPLFYEAYRALYELFESDKLLIEHRMRVGDLYVFNNRRVLHGRRQFDSAARRWLKGTYVDLCDFQDTHRVLAHRHRRNTFEP